MIRLRKDDFEYSLELARLATTARLTPDEFRKQFEDPVAEGRRRCLLINRASASTRSSSSVTVSRLNHDGHDHEHDGLSRSC